MTEAKELRLFIKWKFPVGTVIQDDSCSEPFTIKKNSVFKIIPWDYTDYNDQARPKDRKDYTVEFYVSDPGKRTRIHRLPGWYSLSDCLAIYQDKPPRWVTGVKTYIYTHDRVDVTDPEQVIYCVNEDNLQRTEVLAETMLNVRKTYGIRYYSTKEVRQAYIKENFEAIHKKALENLSILLNILSDGELN